MIHVRSIAVAVAFLTIAVRGTAGRERSDGVALDTIFGSSTLATNIAQIRQQVTRLDAKERFETLSLIVLPSPTHSSIRFAAEFAPAPHQSESGSSVERFESPVVDLIEAAQQAGQLDELRATVAALTFDGEVEQRQRLALLALVEIASGDFDAALPLLDEIEVRHRKATFPQLADRWPETLLLSIAVEHPQLHDTVETMLQRIISTQVRAGHHAGPLVWDVHLLALLGRLKYLQAVEASIRTGGEARPLFGSPPQLIQWAPVSAGDEATFAQGFPHSHWHLFDDRVEKLASHFDEYLYFCSPLCGNFEVECDISGFGHREGQLVIGGHWNWLHYSHRQFDTGNLRGVTGTVQIEPRLSDVNDWVHYRSVVRDGVCRSYINGRLLLTENLRATQFPWLAIRSPYWGSTSIRGVCVTGSPTIPERIDLSSDPELSGWVRYHLDSVGGETADWRFDQSLGPGGGIFARKKDQYAGMFQESLLRYHRPMLEDGAIEYEFEYQPGQSEVAPAIGRRAFLLEPGGVRLHWITDGVWDNSGLDPLNQSEPLSAEECPLRTGWNRLRLELAGDSVTIAVNNQTVLQTEIEPTAERTFGLFHFSDQSEVRVRNMNWSGNWPETLPPLSDQRLRDRTLESIDDRLAQLGDKVEIDFTTQRVQSKPANNALSGIPIPFSGSYAAWRMSDSGESVTLRPEGLMMTRDASQKFNDVQASAHFRVIGDFDIVAEFSDLKVETPYNGNSAIYLVVVADDPLRTHSRVWHGVYAHPGIDRRRVTQIEFNRYRATGVEIGYAGLAAEASDSGRLRIARIGTRMHFMIAEEDSPAYRLLYSADIGDVPLQRDGIRLACGTYDNQNPPSGGVRVTWKRLTMRADRLIPTGFARAASLILND
ncbi:DUF1583 domain-containing protein [bacterium]|nr:DUF1583 domain-containing protein [bacterium]